MNYLNFHTHRPVLEGEFTIPSFGLHPWHLTETWQSDLERAVPTTQSEPFLRGECGLDRLCATPYDRQLAAFEAQIRLSEQWQRPLVLHCVRALDDVLRLKRGTCQPWVFHGFRGKPQQMEQLLKHGFYISFGFAHHTACLRTCPDDRLLLETDDRPEHVAVLYDTAARLRATTPEALNQQCCQNAHSLNS